MRRKKCGSDVGRFIFKSLILIIIALILLARKLEDYSSVETGSSVWDGATEEVSDYLQEYLNEETDRGAEEENAEAVTEELRQEEYTSGRRMYQQLIAEERIIYINMQQTLASGGNICTVGSVPGDYDQTVEWTRRALDAVYYDYPEYFWMNHGGQMTVWEYSGYSKVKIEIGVYDYWELVLDKQAYVDAVDEKAREIAELARNLESTYDKVKFVHDYLVTYAEYDYVAYEEITQTVQRASSQQAHTVYGCLVNRLSVCDGYAKTFQMIMNLLEIKCEYVEGTAGGGHAWNYILLDGENYWMDVTWDDHDRKDEAGNQIYPNGAEYAYFCITSDTLYNTHTPDDTFVIPRCDATEYNFFYRENSYLETYSFEALAAGMEEQKDAQIISFKFGSGEALEQAVNDLFTVNRRYWELPYTENREVRYACDDLRFILSFFYP